MSFRSEAARWSGILGRTLSVVLLVAGFIILWVRVSPAPARVEGNPKAVRGAEAVLGTAQRLSPHETTEWVTRAGKIAIEYGRPFMRKRQIWGGLVPWKRWWMPGADEATVLRIDSSIEVGGLLVP